MMSVVITAASSNLSFEELNLDTSFKAFMDYGTITDRNSTQWEMQQQAHTDENGLRKIDDKYCVAMGTYYADTCGEEFVVELDTGEEFVVVVSDVKMPIHTDETNRYTTLKHKKKTVHNDNGQAMVNVVEFIVDADCLPDIVKTSGTISSLEGFEGNIIRIEKYERSVE
ncbi:MAG: hypothetical protein RSF40_01210 [Oscillospiraceae bacterium]